MANSVTGIVGGAYLLTSLSFLIILSRTLFRCLKHEAFKPDDYLMLASTAIYAAYTGTFIVAVSLQWLTMRSVPSLADELMQRQAYHGTNISQTSVKDWNDDQIQYGIAVLILSADASSLLTNTAVVLGSQSLLLSRIFYTSYLWMLKGCLVYSRVLNSLTAFADTTL